MASETARPHMPYAFLDDIATADVAFQAWGPTREEMFISACEATMNVMVSDLASIEDVERRVLHVRNDALDMLLFDLLQEIIFYKDAEQLLLRVSQVVLAGKSGEIILTARAFGETLDPQKHDLVVDVKAVTLHRYRVEETARGWEATVILDI